MVTEQQRAEKRNKRAADKHRERAAGGTARKVGSVNTQLDAMNVRVRTLEQQIQAMSMVIESNTATNNQRLREFSVMLMSMDMLTQRILAKIVAATPYLCNSTDAANAAYERIVREARASVQEDVSNQIAARIDAEVKAASPEDRSLAEQAARAEEQMRSTPGQEVDPSFREIAGVPEGTLIFA